MGGARNNHTGEITQKADVAYLISVEKGETGTGGLNGERDWESRVKR